MNTQMNTQKAKLLLENGMIFEGKSIGAAGSAFGEIVFNTSMCGYQEILTDPSYGGQVIVMTYPEIGNYGINDDDFESDKICAKGFAVKNLCGEESHYKSVSSLSEYLIKNNIVALSGIDTRELTKIIRENGDMGCLITTEEVTSAQEELKNFKIDKDIVLKVSTNEILRFPNTGKRVGVIDLGIKKNIIEYLKKQNCDITIYPPTTSAQRLLQDKLDAVLLSNGPGDPQNATAAIKTVRELLGKLPLFGICLGHQILSIVLGAKTYKLKYGHRGGNHPVKNLQTNRVFLTSQNHGYCVASEDLRDDVEITFKNINDGTIEGIRCERFMIESVQFHPEGSPGPEDTNLIFNEWTERVESGEWKVES